MKKGFTLVEIILSICIILIIGTISIISFYIVNKNKTISELNGIQEEVLNATKVYIETHSETKNQLYKNKNGLIIPLQTLVADGLLDISGTTLEDRDIEDEYVVSAYTSNSSDGNCIDITTSTSWSLNKSNPLYICTSGGKSNLAIIDPNSSSNLNKVNRETYWFKGSYPNNYAKYGDYDMRIVSVDVDDSITVARTYTNGIAFADAKNENNIFNSNQVFSFPSNACNIAGYCSDKFYLSSTSDIRTKCGSGNLLQTGTEEKKGTKSTGYVYVGPVSYGGYAITSKMYYHTEICDRFSNVEGKDYNSNVYGATTYGYVAYGGSVWLGSNHRYLHLKSCMKITSGAGTPDNPYIITSSC